MSQRRHRTAVGAGLAGLGALAVVIALRAGGAATVPSTGTGALLIGGCELVIAALALNAGRSAVRDSPAGFLGRCAAEAACGVGFACSALIVAYGHSKQSERLVFFTSALVVVPASVVLARGGSRRAAAILQTPDPAVLLGATVVSVIAARLLGGGRASLSLLVLLLASRVVLTPWISVRWRSPAIPIIVLAPLLTVAGLVFFPGVDLHPDRLALAGVVAAAVGCAATRSQVGSPAVTRVLDVVVAAIVVLGVFELNLPETATALNDAYFLGPANDVLHGHQMLVGTFSQYGVGMFDALAGVFTLVPIGYGVMLLIVSALTALLFAAIYAIVRLATRSQLISIVALAVAATLYVYGQPDFYADYPSTGVLRFGLPWVLILLATLAARTSGRRAAILAVAQLLVVAVATVWSGEAAMYCLGTAAAIASFDAAAVAGPWRTRLRAVAWRLLRLGAVACAAIAVFTVATLAATGSAPDAGPYLDFVRMYTTQGIGAQDLVAWSPGIAIGAIYVISAVVIVGLVTVRPDIVRERRSSYLAATGLTAYGALAFTYFLGRAVPTNLIHVSPPAVILAFVWAGIGAAVAGRRRLARAATVATAAFAGGLIVIAQHLAIDGRFTYSVLGLALEHPGQLSATVRAIADNPVVLGQSAQVASFVLSLPDDRRPLGVLVYPQAETEALLRLERGNAFGTTNPCQENISRTGPDRTLERIERVSVGALLVTGTGPTFGQLSPIDRYALALAQARFRMRVIASTGTGLTAYRMTAVRHSWDGGAGVARPPFNPVVLPGCG